MSVLLFLKIRRDSFSNRSASMFVLAFAFMIALCPPNEARAFDLFPEFQVLTEDEQSALDDTVAIDSEYQGDVTAYILPLSWESQFFRTQNPYQIAFGSLSNKLFLQHSRLSLHRSLNESIDFRFTYLLQRDQDIDQSHAYIELVKWLDQRFGVSGYGEPSHFKRENDIGVALLFRPSGRGLLDPRGGHEVRAFHTWVDFTRNKHNNLPDFFREGRDPKVIGLVGRCFGCLGMSRGNGITNASSEAPASESPSPASVPSSPTPPNEIASPAEQIASDATTPPAVRGVSTVLRTDYDYLQYFVRWEQPTTWILPQSNSEYAYEQFAAGVNTRLAPADIRGLFINSRFQYSKKFEGNLPTGTPSIVTNASLDRKIIEALISVELPAQQVQGKDVIFEPGIGWFERNWRGDANTHLIHRNLEAFVKATFDGCRRKEGFDRIELFYDATAFWGEGDLALRSTQLKTATTEHRVGLRYSIPFSDQSELVLMGAADADENGTFEGGHGVFRTSF